MKKVLKCKTTGDINEYFKKVLYGKYSIMFISQERYARYNCRKSCTDIIECVTDLSDGWRGRVGLCQAEPELCAEGAGGVQEADR